MPPARGDVAASSVELLSVSGLTDTSKLVPVVGIAMASWLECRSGTLDSDRALCLSLLKSIPCKLRSSRKPAGVVTTSELLLVENVRPRGLCEPLALLGFAPIFAINPQNVFGEGYLLADLCSSTCLVSLNNFVPALTHVDTRSVSTINVSQGKMCRGSAICTFLE